ncbi:MAG: phospholipase D-like domain-containing protein, partial [Nitrospira sp.]|nr:phospholipase D-like domain-containing protein [Nitrospira sp.]
MASESTASSSRILTCGRTCWRIEPAEQAAFLIDGEAYFKAFRDAALQATHSILIVGWDLDTQIELVRGAGAAQGLPTKLGEFLTALLRRKRRLRVYVLNWDFAMIYALEREWMPTAHTGWRRHRRLSYQVDGQHPLGASHHQKIVVVDDTVAFAGGLDLSKSRWDTSAHAKQDARRVDADGRPYAPFHDVQMLVSGQVAAALGDLARQRWWNATGRRLPRPAPRPLRDVWPADVPADVVDCQVGIMRTQPAFAGQAEVREVERAFLEAIRGAHRSLYIESQYFTANAIGRALAARLAEQDGPDVVLVLRHNSDGWLEQQTMDTLRARLLHDLVLADHYGRFRVYAPTVPGTQGVECVAVHSKLLIADDEVLCLGSANLSNRSMGLDTECNLGLEAQGQAHVRDAIAGLRHRLLGEHLGVEPERVAEEARRRGSLVQAIDALRGGERSLEEVGFEKGASSSSIPEPLLVDPERPIAADDLLDTVVHQGGRRQLGRRLIAGYSLLALVALLALLWRWTPLGEWIDVEAGVAQLQTLGHGPTGFLTLMSGYLLGGLLAVPITVMIVVTMLAFGPWLGVPSA